MCHVSFCYLFMPHVCCPCAVTLTNLSAIADNQVPIVMAKAVQPLIELSKSKDLDTERYCGMALSNLSAHPDNRRYMVTQVRFRYHAP